jgi:Uma2 family endonuclease
MAERAEAIRWTIADVEALANDEWKRYEIVDGELFVSQAPGNLHQLVLNDIQAGLSRWNAEIRLGVVIPGPGLLFTESDAVIPDVVWVSRERRSLIEGEDHHLHGAPELLVEVLSPGSRNEYRDRQAKLKLYSVHGVPEYWIVDWRTQTVAVYRRKRARLQLVATLAEADTLTSPVLPEFAVPVSRLFQWL